MLRPSIISRRNLPILGWMGSILLIGFFHPSSAKAGQSIPPADPQRPSSSADQQPPTIVETESPSLPLEPPNNDLSAESQLDEPSFPVTFSLSYWIMSDYYARGFNNSEYPGEGTEELNHQIASSLSLDLGKAGVFGFDTWFEWYVDQVKINPDARDDDFQEYDLIWWWTYPIEPLATSVTLGYSYLIFPNYSFTFNSDRDEANNNDDRTHELWARIEHNDAWMWEWLWPDNQEGVLNPFVLYVIDVGVGSGNAQWIEFGLNHTFELDEGLTLTPSWVLGIDKNYFKYWNGEPDMTTRLGTMTWGMDLSYDLSTVIDTGRYGSVVLSLVLLYADALGNAEKQGYATNELFGGFGITYTIGG